MKYLILLFAILTSSITSFSQESEVTTYYLIRHAEKDLSNPTEKNPHLSDTGIKRSEDWKNLFNDVSFDAVYSTNYHRTIETAQPTATKNNLDITIYDPRAFNIEDFKKQTEGKIVLIVGHSNTIPKVVNALIGKDEYKDIDESVYGHLYIVKIAKNGIDHSLELVD